MSGPFSLSQSPATRVFHEPHRLAIMSVLCAAERGRAFSDLRDECGLTDGNLNRHLKVLEDAGAVRISKAFVKSKPCTTLRISPKGLTMFSEYLDSLAVVLETARESLPEGTRVPSRLGRPAFA
jgi:DNA-binding MarR family transcriptional regulator